MKAPGFARKLGEVRRLLAQMPRRLTLLSLSIMIGMVLAPVGLCHVTWVQAIREQEQAARDAGLGVCDEFKRVLGEATFKLDAYARTIDTVGHPPSHAMLEQYLADSGDLFTALLIVDHGMVRDSTLGAATLPAGVRFAAAPDQQGFSVAFGSPIQVGGERWLPIPRALLQGTDHEATLVAMLRLSTMARQLGTLRHASGTLTQLYERDGEAIFGDPQQGSQTVSAELRGELTQNFPTVGYRVDPRDHMRHFVVVLPDRAFPFGAVISVPITAFYAAWLPKAVTVTVLGVLLLALMGVLHLTLATELSRRQKAEARLGGAVEEASKLGRQYQLLAEHSSDVIMQIGFDTRCRYVSPAVEHLLGWPTSDFIGKDARFMIHPDDTGLLDEEVQFLTTNCGPIRSHFRARHRQGHYIWVESSMQLVDIGGDTDSFIANLRDISDRIEAERRLAEAASEMAKLAATDQLTGVANRRRFHQELEREWRRAAREELALSIMMLDVDFFKLYNDTYGHQGGDEVLRLVAATIEGVLNRPGDLAARWGGEEFVVLLPVTEIAGAIEVAEQVRAAVETLAIPHKGATRGHLTVSIGVATTHPARDQTSEQLIAEADCHLYEAKRMGRNRVGAPPADPIAWVGT